MKILTEIVTALLKCCGINMLKFPFHQAKLHTKTTNILQRKHAEDGTCRFSGKVKELPLP